MAGWGRFQESGAGRQAGRLGEVTWGSISDPHRTGVPCLFEPLVAFPAAPAPDGTHGE